LLEDYIPPPIALKQNGIPSTLAIAFKKARRNLFKPNNIRSFDWYYQWQQMHDEKQTLKSHDLLKVISVAFSPDGRTLVSGSYDKTLRLGNVGSGKELRKLKGNAGSVWSVAFSPD
jgi:WD40 repeat protein